MDGMAKILVVDDDVDFLGILRQYLNACSLEADLAKSVSQAEDFLKHTKYDALLSDFRMPGKSGLDLLDYVSSHHPGLPFILMTGYASPGLKEKAMKMGSRGFIEKPFAFKNLVEMIRTVLGAERSFREQDPVP
jgi:DNA-binding NtrC family response regulator